MNANAKQQLVGSYNITPTETSPREVESWALLQSADALVDAKANPDDYDGAMTALRANLVLWTIFQSAVLEPDNQLPHEIKLNLLNLSRFVDKHTFRLFGDFRTEKLDILIDINRNIAAGLASRPSDAPTAKVASEDGAVAGAATDSAPEHPKREQAASGSSPAQESLLDRGQSIEV